MTKKELWKKFSIPLKKDEIELFCDKCFVCKKELKVREKVFRFVSDRCDFYDYEYVCKNCFVGGK